MMKSEHIESIAEKFNWEIAKEYAWVHDWLDDCAKKGISLKKHRQYRHHEKGLKKFEEVLKKEHPDAGSDIALKVARQHVIDDIGHVPESEGEFI